MVLITLPFSPNLLSTMSLKCPHLVVREQLGLRIPLTDQHPTPSIQKSGHIKGNVIVEANLSIRIHVCLQTMSHYNDSRVLARFSTNCSLDKIVSSWSRIHSVHCALAITNLLMQWLIDK